MAELTRAEAKVAADVLLYHRENVVDSKLLQAVWLRLRAQAEDENRAEGSALARDP